MNGLIDLSNGLIGFIGFIGWIDGLKVLD